MNVVILHVLSRHKSHDYGTMWVAAPGLSPDERVIVWEGLPPLPVPDLQGVPPVVLVGELDGRRAYVERVPNGVWMSAHAPPSELLPYVVHRVLEALAGLHRARQVHGALGTDRVWLGEDGEVVLIGRGRRGGIAGLDMVAAVSLLPGDAEETLPGEDAAQAAQEIARRVQGGDRARLAAWVRERLPARPAVAEQIVLTVGDDASDSADEVVPDLGPDTGSDSGEGGILDRWAVTTATGRTPEHTPEVTDGRGTSQQRLALTLWSKLSAPPEHPPDPERFRAIEGVASRGLRALLADEPPDALPLPLVAHIGAFAASDGEADQPTLSGRSPAPAPSVGRHPTPTSVAREARRRGWAEMLVAVAVGGVVVWLLLRWLS